jgi:integrase
MGGRGSKQKWLRLGLFQDMQLIKVREVARAYRAMVDKGEDPAAAIAKKADAGATVAEVAERFMREHASARLKPKSKLSYAGAIKNRIIPNLGSVPIRDLDRATVTAWHNHGIGKDGHGAAAANMALTVLSSICTQAEIWGLRQEGANPCRHVNKYYLPPRARDIQPWEIVAIGGALAEMEETCAASQWTFAAIKVTALCAGRVGEVLSLRWDRDLFLDEGYALIREHKTSRIAGAKRLELPPDAVSLIRSLPVVDGNPFVFPGQRGGGSVSYASVVLVWNRVCATAKVKDLHLHDFRSYAASEGLEQGIDARVTAKLLGHSSSRTTERHYLNVRKRKTAEAAAAIAGPVAKAFGLK